MLAAARRMSSSVSALALGSSLAGARLAGAHGTNRAADAYLTSSLESADASGVFSTVSTNDFMLAMPQGAYTTARTTSGGGCLFERDLQVHRLATSVQHLLDRAPDSLSTNGAVREWYRAITDPDQLQPRLLALLRRGREALRAHVGEGALGRELKILVVAPVGPSADACMTRASHGEAPELLLHLSLMPPPRAPPVIVELRPAGGAAHAADTKATQWVRDRRVFEAAKAPDADEVVPYSDAGEAEEGLSSNFAVVLPDGALQTAPDARVLLGSMRKLLLAACVDEAVPVRLSSPLVSQAAEWQGALVTSTSRFALCADRVDVFDAAGACVARHALSAGGAGPASDVAARLATRVRQLVDECASEF